MKIFDRYLFRHLLIATSLTAATLTSIVFLTQSLQFLELVVNSGASSATFWLLTLLAIPKFFEVILPIALMAATVFIYNRMTMDSEIVVMRAVGTTPMGLARPALLLAGLATVLLWGVSIWLAPTTEENMDFMRTAIKSRYSTLLFHEGVFSEVRPGLTVFVRDRSANGELHGIMIYDTRRKDAQPVTLVAKRGQIVAGAAAGQAVVVYNGTRQSIDPKNNNLDLLDFDRYAVDMPGDSGPVRDHWREPGERSFAELLNPGTADPRDVQAQRSFVIELHRRLVSPVLALAYAAIALACLLLGPVDRRGQNWRIALAIVAVIAVQGLFMAAFNLSRKNDAGLVLMYVFAFVPFLGGLALLSPAAERIRRTLFWTRRRT